MARIALGVVALLTLLAEPAMAERPFAARFVTNVPGQIALAGNTLMTCPASDPVCATVQAGGGTGAALSNNAYAMQRVDVDGVGSTFTSSTATLALPAGSTVLFAGLYYGGRVTAGTGGTAAPSSTDAARATVLMRAPGAAGYSTLGPAGTVLDNSTVVAGAYAAFIDVTARSRLRARATTRWPTCRPAAAATVTRAGRWSSRTRTRPSRCAISPSSTACRRSPSGRPA